MSKPVNPYTIGAFLVGSLTLLVAAILIFGGGEFFKKKMPGLQKMSNISLKRGVFAGDNEFYQWYNTVAMNTVERRNITISLLNELHQPKVVWKVKDCFIVSLKCSDMKADANEAAIDTVEIANHGFTMEHVA